MDAHAGPLMPTQVARVTAVSAPTVTFVAANLMDQTFPGGVLCLGTRHWRVCRVFVCCQPSRASHAA